MEKHRMFRLSRKLVEDVSGLERWSLEELQNPEDLSSKRISPIKIAVASKSFGEFRLGPTVLAITQEHLFDQPPQHIRFSLPNEGVHGDSIIHGVNNGRLALMDGEIGSSEGVMYELPALVGVSQALVEWIEDLSMNIYWGS